MAKRSKRKIPAGSRTRASEVKAAPVFALPPWVNRDWFWGLMLIAAVVATYIPIWWAGFIWDDDLVITKNPVIIGPKGLLDIWTSSDADICPLTITTFHFEYALWGLNPLFYHLVNVLLHGASGVVLWHVLRRLGVPGAWLGAAIWALHPVQVESVAWITELKNAQSGLFFLLSILFFLRSIEPSAARREWNRDYALSLLFAAGAEASKSSTVILPLVLGLVAWWAEGRWNLRNQLKAIPVYFMSIAAGLASMANQSQQLTENASALWVRTWPARIITAGDAIWFYLGKLIWPYPLLTIYPRWKPEVASWTSYLPLAAAIALFLVLLFLRRPWSKACLFAYAYFLITLLPVLGLVDMFFLRFSFVADHFQYLPSIGPIALAVAGVVRTANSLRMPTWLPATLAAGVLLVLGITSSQWALLYQTDDRLWTYVLSKNPDSWLGQTRIGVMQMNRGDVDGAMAHFQASLALYPDDNDALNNLAAAYAAKGQIDEAIKHIRRALAIKPSYTDAHYNLAQLLMRENQLQEAIGELQTTIRLNPDHEAAYTNLALIYVQQGRDAEALQDFQKAAAIVPRDPIVYADLGSFFAIRGHFAEAIEQFQHALKLNPGFEAARRDMARAQSQLAAQDAKTNGAQPFPPAGTR
jgi:Flp pilus assembly protein TadD